MAAPASPAVYGVRPDASRRGKRPLAGANGDDDNVAPAGPSDAACTYGRDH